MNTKNAIAVIGQIEPPATNIEVTAQNTNEMAQCQSALIDWCKAKILVVRHEAMELKEAFDAAVKKKWASGTLKRHSERALRRVDFYERMLVGLEHGYQIVPPFPVTLFAIRTKAKNPDRKKDHYYYSTHEQYAPGLPEGEGDYKNPFPTICWESDPSEKDPNRKTYFADAWKDLEFPISMARGRIMEATDRAMALKIFDDFGICPESRNADPIIVARLRRPSWNSYDMRHVSFIIAWHLNTATL